jgi:hypothetical protein
MSNSSAAVSVCGRMTALSILINGSSILRGDENQRARENAKRDSSRLGAFLAQHSLRPRWLVQVASLAS